MQNGTDKEPVPGRSHRFARPCIADLRVCQPNAQMSPFEQSRDVPLGRVRERVLGRMLRRDSGARGGLERASIGGVGPAGYGPDRR